jgi:hypothetical protein
MKKESRLIKTDLPGVARDTATNALIRMDSMSLDAHRAEMGKSRRLLRIEKELERVSRELSELARILKEHTDS